MDEKTVLLIIASQGFQQVEYGVTKNTLQDAGFTVVTASDNSGVAVAKDGSTTDIDYTLDKIIANNYAGIFFIGGPGALEHLDNNASYKIIQDAVHHHIPLGAICVATRMLAKAGIMDGKYATGWNEDGELNKLYADCHAIFLPEEKVVVDSNIITATDPSAAQQFGEHIVELLRSKQRWG